MGIDETHDLSQARRPLVPPVPPRAPDSMGTFRRLLRMSENVITSWSQHHYEEDVILGRFFGHTSFILNTADAIKHVLVDNYENYGRIAAIMRVLRPMFGEGLLTADGKAWKHQRRSLASAFTPRAVNTLIPHMIGVMDETVARLKQESGSPVDLRDVMQRMTLDIAGRTMFSFEMGRHGTTLRALVLEYGRRLANPSLVDMALPLSWPTPRDFARARFRKRWIAFVTMVMVERRAAGKSGDAPPQDLFDLMAAARDPETGAAFSDELLADEVATMILAGHETSSTALFWGAVSVGA